MAARAARLVPDNATVFVDASSTCLAVALALADSGPGPLTLVTNSPAIAFELSADQIHVIVVPGEVDQHMRLIAGRWAIEFLADLNIDIAFLSAAGHHARAGPHHLAASAGRRRERGPRGRGAQHRARSTRPSSGAARCSPSAGRRSSTC